MNYQIISEKSLKTYLEQRCLLLDLREKESFLRAHIPGAVWADWETLPETLPALLEDYRETHMTPPKHIILYCDSGHISLITARDLAVRGYRVMSLNGGFHRWHGKTVPADTAPAAPL